MGINKDIDYLKVLPTVFKHFFKRDSKRDLVWRVADTEVDDDIVVYDAHALVKPQFTEADFFLDCGHFISNLELFHFEEIKVKLDKAFLGHANLLFF